MKWLLIHGRLFFDCTSYGADVWEDSSVGWNYVFRSIEEEKLFALYIFFI